MKELKGIDGNQIIRFSSLEEVKECIRIFTEAGESWKYVDFKLIFETKVGFKKMGTEHYTSSAEEAKGIPSIPAADFIRLNTVTRVTEAELNDEPETPAIPAKWCVRRTPENAEVLNAWAKSKGIFEPKYKSGYIYYDSSESSEAMDKNPFGFPEITFEQWQTIPEHAEWLKEYEKCHICHGLEERKKYCSACDPNEKVEEREIIGYEAPFDMFDGTLKKGTIFIQSLHNKSIYLKKEDPCEQWFWFPSEIVESDFIPVYREKPVFKVGEFAKVTAEHCDTFGKVFEVILVEDGYISLKHPTQNCYHIENLTHATPEEIEAARPKRKYMKQVWRVLRSDNVKAVSLGIFDTEKEGIEHMEKVALEGYYYSCRPVLTVAYE